MKHQFLVRLAAYGFRVGTLFLAITGAAVMVFGTPGALKQALRDSGVYNSVADTVAKQATKDSDLPAADASTAAKSSFTPQSTQNTAEQNIDKVYNWLEGKTAKPEISIDLQPYIGAFTQSLGNQAGERASALPACTVAQLKTLDANNLTDLNLPCLPPGVSASTIKDQVIAQATGSNDFLKKPVITTDSLPKDAEGKTVIDRAASAPDIYSWLTRAPWIFGTLAVVCAAAILLLWRSDWRQAIRKLARSLLGTGITLLVIVTIARLLLWYTTKPGGVANKLVEGDYGAVILTFVKSIERSYDNKLLVAGIVYTATAIIALVVLHYFKKSAAVAETILSDHDMSSNSAKQLNQDDHSEQDHQKVPPIQRD